MNQVLLEQIVEAVLYEGYILYPYRASSKKNSRERFTFGRVYPDAYSRAHNGAEPCVMETQCLVQRTGPATTLRLRVGFLQPLAREIGAVTAEAQQLPAIDEPPFRIVPSLQVGGQLFVPWLEAVERKVELPALNLGLLEGGRQQFPFAFPPVREVKPLRDGTRIAGAELRHQPEIQGTIEVGADPLGPRLFRVTVRILNQTALPSAGATAEDSVLLRTFASTHTVLQVAEGEFVSLLDPPEECKEAAAGCSNSGTWPVLVGDEHVPERNAMLSSPIILYDYPKIASESAGQLFDGTEIDEILTLRVLTMTDQEKREVRNVDALARQLLERTEALSGEAILKMHGSLRRPETEQSMGAPVAFDDFFGANVRRQSVAVAGVEVAPGDRVRIRPKSRADIMDMAMDGRTALIESIEEDIEHRIYLALVLDNDPGKDLGMMRQPGHRFFFGIDEVEPLVEKAA